MAIDANINRIKFLRTKTAGSIPAASLLDEGELAINLADRTIYSKNGANVVELGFGKGGNVSGAITAPQFNGPLVGNASTATKLQTTRTISLAGSATGSISFDGTSDQTISVNVNKLDTLATYTKSNSDSPTQWAQGIQSVFVSSTQGWPMSYGGVITARPYLNGGGALQIMTAYGSDSGVGGGEIKIRTGDYNGLNNDAWTSWKTLVHSENVNNYSPTKTGVGASGDWGISITGNSATTTKLQTPRTISLIGDGVGSASFDGSSNTTINLTLNDVNNSAGTYGANHLEIPTFTLNKKGLLTSAGNRAFPYSGVGQYGAAILYNGLDSYSTSHSATANIVRHLNDVKVDVNKSFKDAFGSDVDYYITHADRKGFTSCADLPVGSRVLLDSIVPFTDLPNMDDGNVYIETKRTYVHPGKLQIAYGYNNARIATRAAGTGGPYSEWRYMASLDSNVASATKLQTARTINGVAFDGSSNITIADNTKLPLTGGTISGQLVAPNILINHSGTAASGISWYGSSYNSWQDYMAKAGSTGNGVNGNLTAPTGTYVNTWARRSVIEPTAGYGWTFETMTMNGTAPSIAAELSVNGTFKTAGDIHGANLTVSGSIHTVGVVNGRSLGVNSTDGSGAGISLHGGASNSMPNYGIAFAQTSNFGTHGSVNGDWATYFTMTYGGNRGWIFRSSDHGNVASISANGIITGNQFKLTETLGTNCITNGNGDAASYSSHNMIVRSHWGIGFRDNLDVCRTVLDTRTGNFSTQGAVHASEVNTHGVRTSNFYSSTAYSFYGPDNSTSQRIKCNSILASNAWADEPYVPHLGIFARGDISSAGNITAWGNITAYSDKRIKEDVTVIENALTKVEQLNGVIFKRKDTLDRQTGLLAQEVEAVLPEAVTRQKASEEIKAIIGDEEVLAVNYGALVGLLVESIKELKAEIDVLKEKVK